MRNPEKPQRDIARIKSQAAAASSHARSDDSPTVEVCRSGLLAGNPAKEGGPKTRRREPETLSYDLKVMCNSKSIINQKKLQQNKTFVTGPRPRSLQGPPPPRTPRPNGTAPRSSDLTTERLAAVQRTIGRSSHAARGDR